MVIRLNPRYPLVWRSPDTIQLGIDRPVTIVPGVTTALERIIAALRGGVPRAGIVMLGRQAGASEPEIAALLRALHPALLITPDGDPESPQPGEAPPTVCVDGQGPTANRLQALLGELGFRLSSSVDEPALAIVIGHYVLEPRRHGHWLRRDIPHLPVVFSDSEVHIGPLVEPGAGPCLYCLELTHVDEDASWPAIACQLLMQRAATETGRISIEVAALVAGIVQDRLQSARSDLTATSLALNAATGALTRRAHQPHERCACRFPPGNVSVPGGSAVAVPRLPSSATDSAVPV